MPRRRRFAIQKIIKWLPESLRILGVSRSGNGVLRFEYYSLVDLRVNLLTWVGRFFSFLIRTGANCGLVVFVFILDNLDLAVYIRALICEWMTYKLLFLV